jgi:hypothetical protein
VNARRTEIANYTREQVKAHLQDALAIVDELDVAPDLEPALVLKAFELLAAKQVVLEPIAGGMLVPSGPAI